MQTVLNTSLAAAVAASLAAGVTITFAVTALCSNKRRITSKQGSSLPPGPPARWFWNSITPTVNISSTFDEWANEYGPVFTLRRSSEIAIVIGRVNAATEIMEKEGSALADRPPSIAAHEFLSGCKRITLMGSGEHFRRLRKAIHTHFQPKMVETYKDIQFEQAATLILDLLNDQEKHQQHVYRYSTSIILRVLYGRSSPTSIDDPEFVAVKELVKHFLEGMRPGAYLVDRFPWFKYVPGYGRHLKMYYKQDLKFYCDQLDRVKRAMSSEDVGPSFSRTLLENSDKNQFSFDQMAYLVGTLFEAGSDSTADAVIAMIMAAACFPDAQRRVQEELDSVVGMDRLPSWNDWSALPQLHAFIMETHRWRPVTPIGFAHRSTRDVIWNGYRIPTGTTVYGNQWAICRDPMAFPDPERFDSQRWLDQNGQLRNDVVCYPFGFGRRVCPGMHFANRLTYTALALILWSFRVVERPDAPIDTTPDKDNAVAHLQQFEVDFVLRINEARLREMIAS